MIEKLFGFVDEVHERAALGLFLSAWLLRLFVGFDDWATVSMFALAAVTLVGQQRFAGLSVGPSGVNFGAQNIVNVDATTTTTNPRAAEADPLDMELSE